jgi:hypothetical protein
VPHQEALTVIVRIKPGRTAAVKALLGTIAEHGNGWNIVPFAKLANVHFARFVVFDDSADLDGTPLPAQLALMTNVDGPLDSHLHDLATDCASGLDTVFDLCEDYPAAAARTATARLAFLRQHHTPARAFYVNRQGRTVQQIVGEEQLRRAINDHLDSRDFSGQPVAEVRRSIGAFVAGRPELAWALDPAEPPSLAWRMGELANQIAYAIVAILLLPVLLLLSPVLILLLRRRERRDTPDHSRAPADVVKRLRADEDYVIQNQVTAAGLFKPGWFRYFLAIAILRLTNYAVRHIYNRGSLSGLSSIHFARWVPLDGRRRLFFTSNYDGSLESYMDDFIDKAAWGLNAIFSSGDGFPRTCFLFCGGITDEKAYKRFLPTRQVQTPVWYSAYPHLTTKNVANNAAIRRGLSGRMNEDEARTWLRRFGAGNQLPESGLIARLFDGIRWDRLCRCCR